MRYSTTSNFIKSNKKIISVAAVAVLLASTVSAFVPSNVPANADGVVCQLNWGLNGGRTKADGTGIRRIGEGANWSINASGLIPSDPFRLDNTNLNDGHVISNGTAKNPFPLISSKDGTFSLYDNTQIDTDGRYTPGVYKTELVTASGVRASCTPSFMIEGDTTGILPGACANIKAYLIGEIVSGSGTTGTARVVNTSDCTFTVSLASYKMYLENTIANSPAWVLTQTLFDSVTVTIGPRQTVDTNVLRVALPNCKYQIDLVEGGVLTPPTYTFDNAPHTVLAYHFGTLPVCSTTPPVQPSGVITASPNPCLIAVGSNVCTSFISWSTQNVTTGRVYVTNTAGDPEKLFGEATSFNNDPAPWIKANIVYTFRLYDYSSGARGALLSSVAVTGIPQTVPPPATGTIQGFKVVMPGNQKIEPAASQTVTLGGTSQTTTNPYFFTNLPAGNHTVTVSVPAGYSVSHMLCYNGVDCFKTMTPGSAATVNLPAGGWADLWWHFTPSILPPPPVAPTVDLKVNGSDGPITINSGSSAALTWTSQNAATCSASSSPATSFAGSRAVQNTAGEFTGALTQATTFTILCSNAVTSVSDAVTVNVINPNPNLTCSPAFQAVALNQNASLNAAGGTGSYFWSASGGNPGSGSAFTTNFFSLGQKNVTVISGGQTALCVVSVFDGGGGDTRGFNINKRVLNVTRGDSSFSDAVSAYPGDRLRFEIRVDTTGNAAQSNVIVRDQLPSQITWIAGTVRQDGASVGNEFELFGNGRNLGTLSAGTTRVITFEATIAGSGSFSGSTTIANSGFVRSDQVGTNRDDAAITVNAQGTITGFSLRKSAWNETQGREATGTVARPGDVIAYTLYYRNTGTGTNFGVIIEDDLSGVKPYARVTDMGGALSVDGAIRYAPVDVAAGVEVSRTFRVTVNDAAYLPVGTVVMTNVYGNSVIITITRTGGPITPLTPPRTGPGEWLMGTLAALTTSGYWLYRRKQLSAVKIIQ